MRKEIKLKDAIGKKFEGFAFSTTISQAVLVFSDGSFSTLGVGGSYFEDPEAEIIEAKIDLFNFSDHALIDTGVIGADELESMREEKYAEINDEELRILEINDRIEYERLQEKYKW